MNNGDASTRTPFVTALLEPPPQRGNRLMLSEQGSSTMSSSTRSAPLASCVAYASSQRRTPSPERPAGQHGIQALRRPLAVRTKTSPLAKSSRNSLL